MKLPNLLITKHLVFPLDIALARLNEIRNRKLNTRDSIIREGLFVLSVSTFENALLDCIRIFYYGFPQKLDKKHSISKECILNDQVLQEVIDATILNISYKNISEIFDNIETIFGLEDLNYSEDTIDIIKEFKASRNLLIHNNLEVNNIYRNTAGKNGRTPTNDKLEIDDNYLSSCIRIQRNVLNNIKLKLENKYSEYTRVRALKKLWELTFENSIIANFDEMWQVSECSDIIEQFIGHDSTINSLSSGERTLLNVWFSIIPGNSIHHKPINFHGLDSNNVDIASFLIKNLQYFRGSISRNNILNPWIV